MFVRFWGVWVEDDSARTRRIRRGRVVTVVTNVVIGLLLVLLVGGCAVALWLTWVPQ